MHHQGVTTPRLSDGALDSGHAERQFKSPCFFFFAFFSAFFSDVRELKSLRLLIIFIFSSCTAVRTSTTVALLYTHGGFAGCWWMSFSAVYRALLLYQVPYTGVLLYRMGGWVDGWVWVDRFVGASMGWWRGGGCFSPAIPAPRWHSSAYRQFYNDVQSEEYFEVVLSRNSSCRAVSLTMLPPT